MAKSKTNGKGPNKSQAIRDLLGQNPKTKTSDVISQLAGKGIKVTSSLVYLIKAKKKQTQRREKRERVAETSRQMGSQSPVELVVRVKELAREVGGYKTLKQLVDVLAE